MLSLVEDTFYFHMTLQLIHLPTPYLLDPKYSYLQYIMYILYTFKILLVKIFLKINEVIISEYKHVQ
jgi:hypothetical protein